MGNWRAPNGSNCKWHTDSSSSERSLVLHALRCAWTLAVGSNSRDSAAQTRDLPQSLSSDRTWLLLHPYPTMKPWISYGAVDSAGGCRQSRCAALAASMLFTVRRHASQNTGPFINPCATFSVAHRPGPHSRRPRQDPCWLPQHAFLPVRLSSESARYIVLLFNRQ